MVFCTLFCLSFFIVITKRKKIYNNNHKKESWGEKTQEYYNWQTVTTQHKYLLMARKERYKNETKQNKHIWQKENQRNWHL